ncbi:fumarylacetoacetate hydrolase family protein [Bacillus sp. B1-b2]|uniref:fumarylacetoacetate hydrolase family protein n=1 Tax=Bacillus sp. B1-b2 TaxID=2653201 RepID=UPI001261CCAC|nr:fumarylacetoacetate hydrolase family protein [Bacillus sp. B1-b2]KAB7665393.1 fumarylacetoacetate hydrolase family protein [Bacillus sp. B1-b2]
MRLITAEYKNKKFVGIVKGDGTGVLPLNDVEEKKSGQRSFSDSLIKCIEQQDFLEQAQSLLNWVKGQNRENDFYLPLDQVKVMAPIPRPKKNIFCVGKNYVEHAIEMGSKEDIPEHVMVFTKAPTTVIGDKEGVLLHQEVTNQLDYEGELAVIIGKQGKGINREEALDYVFGYTILNDITARDLQARHKQFFIGKSLDTSAPMGPWIVTKEDIPNPNNLEVTTKVNGETRQQSNTNHFIFPVEEVIHVLSQGMTLEPGDIIATGTPAGVGKGFKPPKFLKAGDLIEIEVEGIGKLSNEVIG